MQDLSTIITAYPDICEYEKNLPPDTVKAYRIDLNQFWAFTDGAPVDLKLLNRYVNLAALTKMWPT